MRASRRLAGHPSRRVRRSSLLPAAGFFLLAGLSLGKTPIARAQDSLPLNNVLEFARKHAPDMVSAEDDLHVSKHHIGSSVSKYLPRVTGSGGLTYRYNNPAKYDDIFCVEGQDPTVDPCIPGYYIDDSVTFPADSYSLSTKLMGYQPIFAPRQVFSIIKSTKSYRMTELKAKGTEEQLMFELLTDYAGLGSTLQEEKIYERSLELTKDMEKVVAAKLKTGQATDLDMQQATVDREKAALKLAQIHPGLELSGSDMALAAGYQPEVLLRICTLTGAPDQGDDLNLEESTQVQMLEQKVSIDRVSVASEWGGLLPSVSAMGGVTWSGSSQTFDEAKTGFMFDSWYVAGNLSWTLFEGGGRFFDNRTASIQLKQSRRDLENTRTDLLLSDRQTAQKLKDLAAQRTLMERSIDLAEQDVRVMIAKYDAGSATYDMVNQSQDRLEKMRLQLVSMVEQQWKLSAYRGVRAGHVEDVVKMFLEGQDKEQCTDVRAMAVEAR